MIRVGLLIALTVQCVFSCCDLGWTENKGYCYSFSLESVPWLQAGSACLLYSARLIQIESQEKNEWLASEMSARIIDNVWVGGSCRYHSSTWEWPQSGDLVKGFVNWNTGQPSTPNTEQCMHVHKSYLYKWDDADCAGARRFVCEKRMNATSSYTW